MRYLLTMLAFLGILDSPRAADPDFFTEQVRPILARHCFKCHGPDEKARKAKLRLDNRADALRVLAPGKPDESDLVKRIFSDDAEEVMPPAKAKQPLTDAQKQILKKWVTGGAAYTAHWAFVAPRQAPLPDVRKQDWPANALDYFILARLEAAGLQPAAPADRYTLVRRVYLDLIGLPPTPEEADAFVRDTAPRAYERFVDRLLESPHYGERWARRWLDLARYADTNGYEKDRVRSIWPYRDWVIRALNADMPFDQFTIEQVAGDMLPQASLAQRIATGFHRNTMLNEEGGIDPLEFRYYAVVDRVNTTGTVWLGLTLGCAHCHSHKFDPIPQREYFQMMAFLNNADEPILDVPGPENARQRAAIEAKVAAAVAALPSKLPKAELEKKFAEWLQREEARTVGWTILRPVEAKANLPLLTIQDDDSVFASGDQSKSDTYRLKFRTNVKGITAIRLEALPDDRLPRHGPGRVYYEGPFGDFSLSNFTLSVGGKPVKFAKAAHSYASGNSTADKAIDDNLQTGWSIDGGQGRAHVAVFTLAEPLTATEFDLAMLFERYYAVGLGRFRVSVTNSARPAVARDLSNNIEVILAKPTDQRTAAEKKRLLEQFLMSAPELAKERAAIEQLRKQLPAPPTTLVMQERPPENPRATYIHHRGEFMQPTERVEGGVFSFLPPPPKDASRDRLGFARWLVSPENPLVARVTVNRQWAAFFGKGIVRALQDFGYTGEAPSHPELLDWLAVDFVKQGWSMKKLHKLIVMSATYQQASHVSPEALARDADNRLLSHAPRVRLEAELIRDSVLRASGLLAPKLGGPSVFPPQPANITTEGTYGGLAWRVSSGEDRYRRGLYTFSKRTAPYATFSTFDAPSGEACIARRDVSNTPLQALTLLNDSAFTEAAQSLGRAMVVSNGSVEDKATKLFRRCLTRPPEKSEVAKIVQFFENQKRRFAAKELDAGKIAGAGEGDANERAAWTALARVLLNLDEAVVKN